MELSEQVNDLVDIRWRGVAEPLPVQHGAAWIYHFAQVYGSRVIDPPPKTKHRSGNSGSSDIPRSPRHPFGMSVAPFSAASASTASPRRWPHAEEPAPLRRVHRVGSVGAGSVEQDAVQVRCAALGGICRA